MVQTSENYNFGPKFMAIVSIHVGNSTKMVKRAWNFWAVAGASHFCCGCTCNELPGTPKMLESRVLIYDQTTCQILKSSFQQATLPLGLGKGVPLAAGSPLEFGQRPYLTRAPPHGIRFLPPVTRAGQRDRERKKEEASMSSFVFNPFLLSPSVHSSSSSNTISSPSPSSSSSPLFIAFPRSPRRFAFRSQCHAPDSSSGSSSNGGDQKPANGANVSNGTLVSLHESYLAVIGVEK